MQFNACIMLTER